MTAVSVDELRVGPVLAGESPGPGMAGGKATAREVDPIACGVARAGNERIDLRKGPNESERARAEAGRPSLPARPLRAPSDPAFRGASPVPGQPRPARHGTPR